MFSAPKNNRHGIPLDDEDVAYLNFADDFCSQELIENFAHVFVKPSNNRSSKNRS